MAVQLTRRYYALAVLFLCVFFLPFSANALIVKPANNLGLVGYWNLDEGSGTVAHDHGTGAHNGTLTSSPTWTTGRLGGALTFGASNNYVSTSLAWPSTSGSISEWVYPTSYSDWISPSGWKLLGTNNGFVLIDDGGSGTQGKWRAVFNPNVTSGPGEVDVVALQNDTLNAWQYLTMTWNLSGGTYVVHLYVNGVDQGSTTWTGTPGVSGVGNFNFGKSGDYADNYFKGKVDDVRVYNRALPSGEVKALYNQSAGTKLNASGAMLNAGTTLGQGLVGWWTFDGSTISGTTASDSSGNGNNGTLISGPSKVAGKIGQALSFNGINSTVQTGSDAIFTINGAKSFGAWVKWSGSGSETCVLDRANGYAITLASSGAAVVYLQGISGQPFTSTVIVTPGVWTHIFVTWDGTNIFIYKNGVLTQTISAPGPQSLSNDIVGIGATGLGTLFFSGSLDDVRIYNRALSSAEVKQLYQEGSATLNARGTTLQDGTTLSSSLVGYWSFDGSDITDKIYDLSGQGNNAYVVRSVATSSMKVAGKLGQALSFNGTSAYIDAGAGGNVGLSDFTIAAWIKTPAAGSGYPRILDKGFGSGGYTYYIDPTGSMGLGIDGIYQSGGRISGGAADVFDNKWHFVAVVAHRSGVATYYIDGAVDGSTYDISSKVASNLTNSVHIGIGQPVPTTATDVFKGTMDEVRVYNRALSASEIKQLYQLGK